MTQKELQKAIAEALKAENIAEAKRQFSEIYFIVHPNKVGTIHWLRREAGHYESEDGTFRIVEVPETKDHRYFWNVIEENEIIGVAELLASAKFIAEVATTIESDDKSNDEE